MSDIVKRLCSLANSDMPSAMDLIHEARDEIERLRTENRTVIGTLEDAEAEVVRLRATQTVYENVHRTDKAELERLNRGIREYACTATDHACGCYADFVRDTEEIERLRAGWKREADKDCKWALQEIERLRAVLKPMVEHFNVGGGKVPIGKMLEDARRALEGK